MIYGPMPHLTGARRRLATLLLSLGLGACGATGPMPAAPPGTDSARTPGGGIGAPGATADDDADLLSLEADPVAAALTVTGVVQRCDAGLKAARAMAVRLKALKGAPATALRYETTLGRWDRIALVLKEATYLSDLMAVVHPDAAVRASAKLCEPKAEALRTALLLDADVAAVFRAYAEKNEPLSAVRKRLLTDALSDFRRNGNGPAPERKQELLQRSDALERLGQEFQTNLAGAVARVEVSPKQLSGLSEDYKAKHRPDVGGKVLLTTSYADYFPFVTQANDRRAALELYVAFTNRGGDENVQLLERILQKRSEKAKLLGYATWADFAIEPQMARTPRAVRELWRR